ncbi:endochitinase 2 [Gossypium australe]|uniref:Endochitinase 2 n=1 Tax=Gossypium australe TaxID=47621 RepID=A0A5B6W0H7_9ROSI|nr:endochitinase 2 [Gossypium australe]
MFLQQKRAEDKQEVLYVQMDSVAVNLGCVAARLTTAEMAARASVVAMMLAALSLNTSFNQMLKYRNDSRCPGNGFYTYSAFIAAARSFNGFGTTGNLTIRKRELAAFLAQTSHETTGGWPSAPDGPYAWGYCYIREQNNLGAYCSPGVWSCPLGRFNFNYGLAGRDIGVDLINNPDLVATNSTISFKTAIWFWMTPQANKPSSHNVIDGQWTPSTAERDAGWLPGY